MPNDGYGRCMNAKLVSIFAAAGVVAAGSSAYAINAQSLKSETTSKVGTATMDLKNKQLVISSIPNNDQPASSDIMNNPNSDESVTGSTEISLPINDPQVNDNGLGSEDSGASTVGSPTDQTTKPIPTAAPTDPVFPTTSPSYKPGQGNEDDESDDQGDDRYETHDHEDSNGGDDSSGHDD